MIKSEGKARGDSTRPHKEYTPSMPTNNTDSKGRGNPPSSSSPPPIDDTKDLSLLSREILGYFYVPVSFGRTRVFYPEAPVCAYVSSAHAGDLRSPNAILLSRTSSLPTPTQPRTSAASSLSLRFSLQTFA